MAEGPGACSFVAHPPCLLWDADEQSAGSGVAAGASALSEPEPRRAADEVGLPRTNFGRRLNRVLQAPVEQLLADGRSRRVRGDTGFRTAVAACWLRSLSGVADVRSLLDRLAHLNATRSAMPRIVRSTSASPGGSVLSSRSLRRRGLANQSDRRAALRAGTGSPLGRRGGGVVEHAADDCVPGENLRARQLLAATPVRQ